MDGNDSKANPLNGKICEDSASHEGIEKFKSDDTRDIVIILLILLQCSILPKSF
jgi:hypothetical protein